MFSCTINNQNIKSSQTDFVPHYKLWYSLRSQSTAQNQQSYKEESLLILHRSLCSSDLIHKLVVNRDR